MSERKGVGISSAGKLLIFMSLTLNAAHAPNGL